MRKANGKCHIQITKNGVDGIIPATAITQRNYLFPILSGVHPWAEFPLGRIGEGPEHTEGHSVSYDAFLIAIRNVDARAHLAQAHALLVHSPVAEVFVSAASQNTNFSQAHDPQ